MSELQPVLAIDDEFRSLIPPLHKDEYRLLESSIRAEGCRDPIVVWDGVIIDGHNRYRICSHWHIPFSIIDKQFNSREEAVAWICATQLGRRNISDEMRKYLIGKRYEAEKKAFKTSQTPWWSTASVSGSESTGIYELLASGADVPNTPRGKNPTAERIGDEYHLSHSTVQKYGRYSRAIDLISKESPALAPKILSGELKIAHDNLISISKLQGAAMRKVVRQLEPPQERASMRYRDTRERLHVIEPTEPIEIHPGIKKMPEYNPDAAIKELILTIPTWRDSIIRTMNQCDIPKTTPQAREQLSTALNELRLTIDQITAVLKE